MLVIGCGQLLRSLVSVTATILYGDFSVVAARQIVALSGTVQICDFPPSACGGIGIRGKLKPCFILGSTPSMPTKNLGFEKF